VRKILLLLGALAFPVQAGFVGNTAIMYPAAGGAFSPEDPTSATLIGWFDADDSGTIWTTSARTANVTSNLDPVGAWDDKSATSPDLSVSINNPNRPEYQTNVHNSKPGISFVAGDTNQLENLSYTLSLSGVSIFFVYEHVTQVDNGRLMVLHDGGTNDYDSPDSIMIQQTESWEGNLVRAYNDSALVVDSSTLSNTTVYLLQFDYQFTGSPAGEMFVDGTSTSTDTTGGPNATADPTEIYIGVGQEGGDVAWSTINILEILIYDAVVSGADQTDIETYIDDKWAIAGL